MSLFLPMPLFLWPMCSGRMVTQRVKHMVFLPKTNGIIAITVAAILFGTAGAFAKLLFTVQVSPVDLTAIRTIVALVVFGLFLGATSRPSLYLERAHLPLLLASGVTFTAVNITFYMAISKISVAAAITLEYTAPFFCPVDIRCCGHTPPARC